MKKLLLLLFFSSAAGVWAQTAAHVYVCFHFQVASATNNIVGLPAVEQAVSERLAEKCADAFPYWTMVGTQSNAFPVLSVWLTKDGLTEDAPWSLRMRLASSKLSQRVEWRGTLFPPGEFTRVAGTLTTNRWAEVIAARFESDLLAGQSGAIQEALQSHAPLGGDVVLTEHPALPPNPLEYVVLPLEWQSYSQMSASDFVIQCRVTNGIVSLHSVGIARKAEFTPTHRLFDGIAVRLREWEFLGIKTPITNHLDELGGLQPTVFFLKTPREVQTEWTSTDQ